MKSFSTRIGLTAAYRVWLLMDAIPVCLKYLHIGLDFYTHNTAGEARNDLLLSDVPRYTRQGHTHTWF